MTIAIDAVTGRPRSLTVDEDGALIVVGGTGGSGGDASLSEQETQTALLVDIESAVDGIETALAAQLAITPTPKNSVGGALPTNFEYLPETFGYTGSNLTTIVKTNGVNTWTQTLAYTGAVLNSISAWVQT